LAEIGAELEEMLNILITDEAVGDIFNEEVDAFVTTKVAKEAKQLKAETKTNGAFAEDTFEAKIIKVDALITEEKELKKTTQN
jgi:type I restriction enzyme M protein